jgi:hypothetical protein
MACHHAVAMLLFGLFPCFLIGRFGLLKIPALLFFMEKEALLARFAGFVERLSVRDDVGVLVHCDPDGLASAVVLLEALKQKTGKEAKALACSQYGGQELMQKKLDFFEYARCNKLLVADLSFDQDDFFLKGAEKFCEEILFIDHHKVYRDWNSKKTVFIKASFVSSIDSSNYPASKLCFDLFSGLLDLHRVDWVVSVGILGDVAGAQWKEFIEKTLERNHCTFNELDSCREIIEAVGLLEPFRFSELLRAFWHARSPTEILRSSFSRALAEMRSEMDYWMQKFKEEKEVFPELELVWFECKPRFPIKSPLVNRISFELHPDQTVVFVQDIREKDSHVTISARRQDGKVKVNDLLENAVKGIPDSMGGGHAPAAGARVPREFLSKFKDNLLRELKKQYQKK